MSVTTETEHRPDTGVSSDLAHVDPRAPRFGQALTSLGLGGAVVLDRPVLLFAMAAVMAAAVVSRWRLDVYAALWRTLAQPVLGPPADPEPAAPHRFARVLGATGATLATALVLAGFSLPGYLVAGAVAALAGFAAATGICVGCRMYRQVAYFRRLNVV